MPKSASVGAIQGGRVAVAVTLDDAQFLGGVSRVKNSLRTLSAGLNKFANGVIRAGMAMSVPLAAAMREFSNFDHQMRVVRAVTQASETQFAALTDRARELGKTTSWTAREVAEGMTNLGRMGWKPKEIDATISAMMDLARATDSDVATVSTLASNTMRAFKATTDQATHYADVLAVAANKSAQTVVDIGEAMTVVGPIAKQAGQSFEDIAAALMVMANNGVRGSIAGTALRNAMVKLNDSARQETLAKYNVKVRDVYGNMRKLAEIIGDLYRNTQSLGTGELITLSSEIFGLRGMLGGTVLTSSIEEVAETIKDVGNSAGYANRVARGMEEGIWGATKIAVSAFQDLAIAIGKALSPTIESKLSRITTFVRGLSTWVKNNKEQVKEAAKWIWDALKATLELKAALMLGSAIAGVVKLAGAFGKLTAGILAAKTAAAGIGAIGMGAGGAAAAGGAVGKAAAAGAARAGAAGAGGALGAAANGAIVASSLGGLGGGGGGVRSAWRQWRNARKQVAAREVEVFARRNLQTAAAWGAYRAKKEVDVARLGVKSLQGRTVPKEVAVAAGSRLGQAGQAAKSANKLLATNKAASVAANAALLGSMAQSSQAAANFAAAIAKATLNVGKLGVVAGAAYLAWNRVSKLMGLLAELGEQKIANALAEEDARKRALENLSKITSNANADAVREQINWLRNGLGEIVAYVNQRNKGELTARGEEIMMERARGIGEEYGVAAEKIIGMAVQAVYRNNYDELNKWMQSKVDWEVGRAKYLFGEGKKIALNNDLQGTEEYKALYKAMGQFASSTFNVSAIGQLDLTNATRASLADKRMELPKTDDLAALETSLAEDAMTPYEKSIAELSKRQEEYAALIKAKIEELQRLIDTEANTAEAQDRLRAEIGKLQDQQAAFNSQVEGQKLDAARSEWASRINNVSSAVENAIKQQAELGDTGKKVAETMKREWLGRFGNVFQSLREKLASARQQAVSPASEGGATVTENEQKRIGLLSSAFVAVAEKLNALRNLDIGQEVSNAASVTGSFKASEVFGQIMGVGKYDEETAKNTKGQLEASKNALWIAKEQKALLQQIASNSGLVFG